MTSPSDLFLSPDLTEEDARRYLRSLGFRDPDATDRHFQSMVDDVAIREAMGRIAGDLLPALLESPDPDAAVVGLSHYLAARTGRAMFLDYLAEDPRAMHVLACVFGSSPLLSEILVRNPENFHWLVSQVERSAPERRDLEEELDAALAHVDAVPDALDVVRRWKRKELLRIATRDLLRRETVPTATSQLSDVAGVVIDRVLAMTVDQMLRMESRRAAPWNVAVIGLGALGAGELGYAPDVDLLYVFESAGGSGWRGPHIDKFGADLTHALDGTSEDDCIYHARANACLVDEYSGWLRKAGGMAARLALVHGRVAAGDQELGNRFLLGVQPFVFSQTLNRAAIGELLRERHDADPGAQQVERVTQLLQLAYGATNAAVRVPGTLAALEALSAAGCVPDNVRRELAQAYVLSRTVEHRLQLVERDHTGLGSADDLDKQVSASRARIGEICRHIADEWKDDG